MSSQRSGTKVPETPADAKPEAPNGVPEQPSLATLKALADQARAALEAAEKAASDAQAIEDAKVRKEQLAGVRTAAEAIVADTDPDTGKADLEAMFAQAKIVFETVRDMAKAAKVRTGGSGRTRGPVGPGWTPKAGSDAAWALEFLRDNPSWQTVRAVSAAGEVALAKGHNADGQFRNALENLATAGMAERRDAGTLEFRIKPAEDTSVIDGAGTKPPADGDTPTE